MSKCFYVQQNVGSVKYLLSYHDGRHFHQDGSPFYDIKCFSSKKKLDAFINTLLKMEYSQK